ncbi:uncharacterized protein [Asterias amurensis]|uniref:uncharacterized protein n=1 Tax=Asterias amurensis TaxID=7602 RepID=UPI003AB217DE
MLQLNDSKTDFFVCANSRCLSLLSDVSLQVDSEIIQPSTNIRYLGVEFDQVTSICRSVNFSLRNLSRIRMYIDKPTCHAAVRALVTSHLDNANSLLYGISSVDCQRLQRLQNRAAKLIYQAKKYDRVTPILHDLHWLTVSNRINFKILTLVFKCLNTASAPSYLTDLIQLYKPNRYLRSSTDTRLLAIPKTRTTTGEKSFHAAAPKLWNDLPHSIRHSSSLAAFKKSLKTHLFT